MMVTDLANANAISKPQFSAIQRIFGSFLGRSVAVLSAVPFVLASEDQGDGESSSLAGDCFLRALGLVIVLAAGYLVVCVGNKRKEHPYA